MMAQGAGCWRVGPAARWSGEVAGKVAMTRGAPVVTKAAAEFSVGVSTINRWLADGFMPGEQRPGQRRPPV